MSLHDLAGAGARRRRVVPHGGGAQARFYGGAGGVPVCGAEVVALAEAVCGLEGEIAGAGPEDVAGETVFALPAGPGVAMGRFLEAKLPYFWGAAAAWPQAYLAGRAPVPAQMRVLERLGLARRVARLNAPRRFKTVLDCVPERAGAVVAGAEYLAMMARLRAEAGSQVPFAVAVLPGAAKQRFGLSNRASLSAWLRARRFMLLAPEAEDFEATAAALGRANLVVMADAADAGLLGLCRPGCTVLEIAPEGWATGKIRAFCGVLGLRWELFLAGAPSYPLTRRLSFGAAAAMAYEVPIAALAQVLRVV